jgi:hypothetical protein
LEASKVKKTISKLGVLALGHGYGCGGSSYHQRMYASIKVVYFALAYLGEEEEEEEAISS